jgi:hypothetical protein
MTIQQGSAPVACLAHNQEVAGSIPAPATSFRRGFGRGGPCSPVDGRRPARRSLSVFLPNLPAGSRSPALSLSRIPEPAEPVDPSQATVRGHEIPMTTASELGEGEAGLRRAPSAAGSDEADLAAHQAAGSAPRATRAGGLHPSLRLSNSG